MNFREKMMQSLSILKHKAFRWVRDEDEDIGLEILGFITLVKYKNHTIIELFKNHPNAEKYV